MRAVAQLAHHRAGRMRHVGVERRAEERQPAGHRRLHVGAEAQRPPRHLRHDGKAAIELDGVELPCRRRSTMSITAFKHGVLRMAFVKLVADQIIARLLRRRAAAGCRSMRSSARRRRARVATTGHQQRAAHVDGRIGDHQLGVGPCDQPVVRRRRRDLSGETARFSQELGISRGDAANSATRDSPDSANASRGVWPQCAEVADFVKRIDRDRPEHAERHGHRLLERRAAFRLRHVMRERRPRQRHFGALGLGRGRLRLGAADHGDA